MGPAFVGPLAPYATYGESPPPPKPFNRHLTDIELDQSSEGLQRFPEQLRNALPR